MRAARASNDTRAEPKTFAVTTEARRLEVVTLFHLTTRSSWHAALEAGEYRPPSLSTEGFVHLSTAAQWLRTANRFYRGVPDLVRLAIDETALESPLVFEAPAHPVVPGVSAVTEPAGAGEELFPHLYGPLPTKAVTAVFDLVLGPDGLFVDEDGLEHASSR